MSEVTGHVNGIYATLRLIAFIAGAAITVYKTYVVLDRRIEESEGKAVQVEKALAAAVLRLETLEKVGSSKQGPPGLPGARGEPGLKGEPGVSVDMQEIDRRIAAAVTKQFGAARPRSDAANQAPQQTTSGQTYLNGTLGIEVKECGRLVSDSGNIYCEVSLSNLTPQDKKICFGRSSRMVTDTGASFSASNGYYVAVGSVNSYVSSSSNDVCDTLTPMTKMSGWVRFLGSSKSANSVIQFFRLDCGGGCVYEARNIQVK
jgi:hypothetical protein